MAKKPKRHELQSRAFRTSHGLEADKRTRLILPERHLFVTEGTKTEPYYLQGWIDLICQRYGSAAKRQFEIHGEGTNTLDLLQRAEERQYNRSGDFQHVWILYDKDDFPADSFDNTEGRCEALNRRFQEEGRDTRFHALWSNSCIELWFVLHFSYLVSDIDRGQYQEILSQCLGRHYEKNDPELFADLYPHLDEAIRNAKRLMERYPDNIPPSQKAPATKLYELAEHLSGYIPAEDKKTP